ncbi:glycoprotein endo-alpha-1,2-mannosidase-like protein isoform X2 [Denticeps clupeoides]|uniref:glycoprotein endo-alpha-1,2-mannosidase-like protein isoform X2 n=1 Tax=Denticeps clupeoides TaxID=299321 RepID=UPI0010A371AE|nr:glycoprotein endo-alpha-1,2-mannosidase-like protein isoform X2 [Denticeps clupeoides]
MARLRRKACVALFLFTLFVFGTMMGLRTLKPSDGFSDLAPGLDPMPVDRRPASPGGHTKVVLSHSGPDRSIFYDVHIFYYMWYGSPQMDGKYLHWDHVLVPHWDPKIAASYPKGRHAPPEDLGCSFYPELGPYSSRDPEVLESHMEQMEAAAAGVLVVSWYPPGLADDNGESTEDLVPALLDAAHRHSLKVAFHLQPYKGRTDHSVHDNIKYIIDRTGRPSRHSATETTCCSCPVWGRATSTPACVRGTTTTHATASTDAITRRPCRRHSTSGPRSSPSRPSTSGTRARRSREPCPRRR